jgi:hypothetical protein
VAITLNKLYVKSFERRVRQLAQQVDARLRPWCQENGEAGSTHNWPRMAAQSFASKATTGRIATPANDSVWSNRVSVVGTYHGGDTSEVEDINQLLIDPNSNVVTVLGAAAKRTTDDVIIAAAGGNALDEAGGNTAFTAGQTVGDYSGELDFLATTSVAELFLSHDIEPEEPKCFVIGPKQAQKILHLVQATQQFYVGNALALISTGFVKNWMGFDWIMSNRLLAPQATERQCFALTRKGMGLQVSKDIWTRVAEDPSISFAWRIYAAMTMGAVRVEDEHIVQFQAKDTVTVA